MGWKAGIAFYNSLEEVRDKIVQIQVENPILTSYPPFLALL